MTGSLCQFEELAHTAEIGMCVHAPDLPALFACAAAGMFALVGVCTEDPGGVPSATSFSLTLDAVDTESLLVDFLSELVYLYDTTGVACADVEIIAWKPTSLQANARGWRPTEVPRMQIKAVTYHGLEIVAAEVGWQATVYFDI